MNSKSCTILCIDDEPMNLKVLADFFQDSYTVIVCKDAKQGQKKAIELAPDLILLDVNMPEENGFELILKLKADEITSHIPVIFITGLNDRESEEKGFDLGACDFISKPFYRGIVQARVHFQLEMVRQRKLLEHIAHIDVLTELPNRRKWKIDGERVWKNAIVSQKTYVFGIIDIDNFKSYNDHYGHPQGDVVLQSIAASLNTLFTQYNGQIYRCGGEEFYFYFPAEQADIQSILDQCISNVYQLGIEHSQEENHDVVTISLGAVQTQVQPEQSLLNIINMADKNLYLVKNTTKNLSKLSKCL